MPSTQALRRRIKSVRSTRQITKAMELVSAAKMRRATEATLASRPYVKSARTVLADLLKQPIEGLVHPLLADRPIKNVLAVVIASDRTLAGSYNANVLKKTLTLLRESEDAGQTIEFITLGKQVDRFLNRLDAKIIQSYVFDKESTSSSLLVPISHTMTTGFLGGMYDKVVVVSTDFHSLLTQEANVTQLLPLAGKVDPNHDQREFIYEPNPLSVLNAVLPRLLEAELYQCIQESLASEHASRRMAMKSASDNASDMIDDLTLTYNGIRQSSITRELAEITGGAAALET